MWQRGCGFFIPWEYEKSARNYAKLPIFKCVLLVLPVENLPWNCSKVHKLHIYILGYSRKWDKIFKIRSLKGKLKYWLQSETFLEKLLQFFGFLISCESGILFWKLFWSTTRKKIFSFSEKKFKEPNMYKSFEINRTIYSFEQWKFRTFFET